MKEKSPAFQFYPKDWLTSLTTRQMTLAQRSVYIDLLSYSWIGNGLPEDTDAICNLVGGDKKDIEAVLMLSFKNIDGKLRNERQEKERVKQKEWREKSSKGGKKSAKKRWGKGGGKGGYKKVVTNVQPKDNSSVCSLQSSSLKQDLKTYIVVFDHWQLQPHLQKHRSLKGATADRIKKAINGRLAEDYTEEDILTAITNYNIVIGNPRQFFTHRWPLDDFLKRSGGFPNFVDSSEPWKKWMKEAEAGDFEPDLNA